MQIKQLQQKLNKHTNYLVFSSFTNILSYLINFIIGDIITGDQRVQPFHIKAFCIIQLISYSFGDFDRIAAHPRFFNWVHAN